MRLAALEMAGTVPTPPGWAPALPVAARGSTAPAASRPAAVRHSLTFGQAGCPHAQRTAARSDPHRHPARRRRSAGRRRRLPRRTPCWSPCRAAGIHRTSRSPPSPLPVTLPPPPRGSRVRRGYPPGVGLAGLGLLCLGLACLGLVCLG